MKKKLTAILTLLIIILSFTGCSSEERESVPFQTFFKTKSEKIDLKKTDIFSNSVEVYIPKSYDKAPDWFLKRYTNSSDGPAVAYGNGSSSAAICFQHYNIETNDLEIPTYLKTFKKMFMKEFPSSTVFNSSTNIVNGKNVCSIEVKDFDKENDLTGYIVFLEINKKPLFGFFLCKSDEYEEYRPVFQSIIESIKEK